MPGGPGTPGVPSEKPKTENVEKPKDAASDAPEPKAALSEPKEEKPKDPEGIKERAKKSWVWFNSLSGIRCVRQISNALMDRVNRKMVLGFLIWDMLVTLALTAFYFLHDNVANLGFIGSEHSTRMAGVFRLLTVLFGIIVVMARYHRMVGHFFSLFVLNWFVLLAFFLIPIARLGCSCSDADSTWEECNAMQDFWYEMNGLHLNFHIKPEWWRVKLAGQQNKDIIEEEMPDQDYEKTEQFRQMLEQMRTGLEAPPKPPLGSRGRRKTESFLELEESFVEMPRNLHAASVAVESQESVRSASVHPHLPKRLLGTQNLDWEDRDNAGRAETDRSESGSGDAEGAVSFWLTPKASPSLLEHDEWLVHAREPEPPAPATTAAPAATAATSTAAPAATVQAGNTTTSPEQREARRTLLAKFKSDVLGAARKVGNQNMMERRGTAAAENCTQKTYQGKAAAVGRALMELGRSVADGADGEGGRQMSVNNTQLARMMLQQSLTKEMDKKIHFTIVETVKNLLEQPEFKAILCVYSLSHKLDEPANGKGIMLRLSAGALMRRGEAAQYGEEGHTRTATGAAAGQEEAAQQRQTNYGALQEQLEQMPVSQGMLLLKEFHQDVCRCADEDSCRRSEAGQSWCFVDNSTLVGCKIEGVKLLKDTNNRTWSYDLCDKRPCEPANLGMKPKPSERADLDTERHPELSNNNTLISYGSYCDTWKKTDKLMWAYVGFDTTCVERTRKLVPKNGDFPPGLPYMFQSWTACTGNKLWDTKRPDGTVGALYDVKVKCMWYQTVLECFIIADLMFTVPMMVIMYYFIANRCADNFEVEEHFVPVDTESESESEDEAKEATTPPAPAPAPAAKAAAK
ncbi:unnamed protein product [Effrenium voratum]|nr:unnamed protein product [Effrenium voratum]